MSPQSQAVFDQAWRDYLATGNAEALRIAAVGHIGASRRLEVLLEEYAEAMENQGRHTPEQAAAAQALADELEPVRTATLVAAGHLPPRMGG